MERPADSRAAAAAPTRDGVVVTLPAQGVRRFWWFWCGYVWLAAGEAVVVGCLFTQVILVGAWWGRLAWLGALAAFVAVMLPPTVKLTRVVFDYSLGHGTLAVSGRSLCLRWRVLLWEQEHAWEAASIAALDEEAGTLCVLADGRLDRFLDGRDRGEVRWAAEVLRESLGAPASPPPLTGELAVRYRLAGWPEPLCGFVLIEPGLLCLRPRFSMDVALALRPAERGRTSWSGDMPDSVAVEADDVGWGVSDGRRVLRVWLYPRGAGAVALEITSPHDAELAARLGRLWGWR